MTSRARLILMGLGLLTTVLAVAFDLGRRQGRAEDAGIRDAAIVETLTVVDTQYRTDTLRLTRWRTRFDTLVLTRDQWKHDTVEVERFVFVADSTVRACTQALTTCEKRTRLLTARVDLLQKQLDVISGISKRDKALWMAAGAGLGLVAGVVIR